MSALLEACLPICLALFLLLPAGLFALTLGLKITLAPPYAPLLARWGPRVQGVLLGNALLLTFTQTVYQGQLFTWFQHHHPYAYTVHMEPFVGAFLILVALLSGIISYFSHNYLAHEPGYYKFFLNFYLMQFALYSFLLSDKLFFLLMAWELLGLSSVFLVSFYQNAHKTAHNALFVLSIYKCCDFFLIAALFFHPPSLLFLTLLWLASLGKSGQFPFSRWLPRAMEGPTTSSAIFYGALSIHAGLLLLLKFRHGFALYPTLNAIIGTMGLLTACYALLKSRVQSDVKATLAYATVAQVGFMYLEFALGYYTWVVLHMYGNAMLRSYQFLRSPSNIHQFHELERLHHEPFPTPGRGYQWIPSRLRFGFYTLVYHNFGLTLLWQKLAQPFQALHTWALQPLHPSLHLLWLAMWVLWAGMGHRYGLAALGLISALFYSLRSLRHDTLAHNLKALTASYGYLSFMTLLWLEGSAFVDAIAYFGVNIVSLGLLHLFCHFLTRRLEISDIRSYLGLGQRYPYMNMLAMAILLLATFTPGFASFIIFDLVLSAVFNTSKTLGFVFLALHLLNSYATFALVFKLMFGEPPGASQEWPDFTLRERLKLLALILPMVVFGVLPMLLYR